MNLEQIFQKGSFKSLFRTAFGSGIVRRATMSFIEKKMWQAIVENNPDTLPFQVKKDKYDITVAIVHSIARGVSRGTISKKAMNRLFDTLMDNVFLSKQFLLVREKSVTSTVRVVTHAVIHNRLLSWTGIHLTGLSLKRNVYGVRTLRLSLAVSRLCGKIMIWTF